MSERKKKQLELKRRNIIDSVSRIEKYLQDFNHDRDQHELAIRLEKLDTVMIDFEAIQGEYEIFEDSESFATANVELRANMEEKFFRIKGGLLSKLPPPVANPVHPQHSTSVMVPHTSNVKLPTIALPEFDGDLNEWLTFHDSFISLIHTSVEIPSIQKFQYLRSALKGEALKLIESLTITTNNYAIAWEALLERYSNKYLLKKKHLQSLLFSAKVCNKSPHALRTVIEDFERHIKILTQLGEPTQHWSSLLVQLLCSRLDDRTLKDWEEYISNDGEPTYANLISFLTKKSRALESLSMVAESNVAAHIKQIHAPRQPKLAHISPAARINAYTATDSPQPHCLACNQYHLLVKCPVFEKMPLKERLQLVNTKKICSNCFRSDHFVRQCNSTYSCRICQKRHHSLLHPGFEPTNFSNRIPPGNFSQQSFRQQNVSSNFVELVEEEPVIKSNPPMVCNAGADSRSCNVLLSTVVLVIYDSFGKGHLARALSDQPICRWCW